MRQQMSKRTLPLGEDWPLNTALFLQAWFQAWFQRPGCLFRHLWCPHASDRIRLERPRTNKAWSVPQTSSEGRSNSNSEPFGEASIERCVNDIVVAPKTEDKEELSSCGARRLCSPPLPLRIEVLMECLQLLNYTRTERESWGIKSSVLVAHDIKSPLRAKQK